MGQPAPALLAVQPSLSLLAGTAVEEQLRALADAVRGLEDVVLILSGAVIGAAPQATAVILEELGEQVKLARQLGHPHRAEPIEAVRQGIAKTVSAAALSRLTLTRN